MVALIGEVRCYAFDAPYEVGVGVRSIETYASCHGSVVADVRMPRMRYGSVFIFDEEAKLRCSIDAREGIGQVNDHPEVVRIEGFALRVRDAAYTTDVVVDAITDGQTVGIGAMDAPLDVGS